MEGSGFRLSRAPHSCFSASILLASSFVASCLVTSNVDYDQDVIPSVVERVEPAGEFARVGDLPDERCKEIGTRDGHMLFIIKISDLNREEALVERTIIDGERIDSAYDIEASGRVERKEFPFCVKERDLRAPCTLIEAAVSSSFPTSRDRPRFTKEPGDLGIAQWYVIGKAADNSTASYLNCPGVPDAGVP